MRYLLIFFLVVVSLPFLGCEIIEMGVWQEKNAARVEQEFGFSYGTPYLRFGKRHSEIMRFEKVDPDGIIGQAGIKSGDIILIDFPWPTTHGLHRYLDENRGKEVEISVTDGGDGPPLRDRVIRTYIIKIPNKQDAGDSK